MLLQNLFLSGATTKISGNQSLSYQKKYIYSSGVEGIGVFKNTFSTFLIKPQMANCFNNCIITWTKREQTINQTDIWFGFARLLVSWKGSKKLENI